MFVTEVDFNIELSLEIFVVYEQKIIVESHCFEFGKPSSDSSKPVLHCSDRDRMDFLKECGATLSVRHNQKHSFTRLTRSDEIALGVADAFSVLDYLGSFVDHAFVRNLES